MRTDNAPTQNPNTAVDDTVATAPAATGEPRGKLRFRPNRRGWILMGVVGLTLFAFAADAVASAGRVRPRVAVGGLELGGMREAEAERLLTERAQLLAAEPAEFFTDGHRVGITPEEVGFFPDVGSTLDEAMAVGRRGNVFVRSWHKLRSRLAGTEVGWVSEIDREAAAQIIGDWAEQFDDPGHEAAITVRSEQLVPVEPKPARRLDRRRTLATIVTGMQTHPRRSLELPFTVTRANTDMEDAERAAERANALIRAPITLSAPDGEVVLQRAELAPLLEAVPGRRGEGWVLLVRFSPELVAEHLGPRMSQFEREPRSATFAAGGGTVNVVPSVNGLSFDAEKTAAALDAAAPNDPPRRAEAAFSEREPALTTQAAQNLKITELVSTFTTNFPCCPPRVRNIQRIAQAVDGTLVRPGESFSLNRHVGPRTREKGYVEAPMIYDGEYRDQVGGGVSQFATTIFNAIFFGGYRIDAHRAHSYYISRYPPGREATISWPHPDLRFTNNSSSGILIKASAGNTSVTVSFYGNKEGRSVRAEAGERTNFTDPPEQRRFNPNLPPGSERVVQSGSRGFDIVVFRIITKDGNENRQRFHTRYRPEPRIVEYGPEAAPTPPPEQEEPPPAEEPPPDNGSPPPPEDD